MSPKHTRDDADVSVARKKVKSSAKRRVNADTDGESDDAARSPTYQAKQAVAGSATPEKKIGDDDSIYWELPNNKRASISKYRNNILVSVREYYDNGTKMMPGKKGISLPVETYHQLLKILPALNEELRKQGYDVEDAPASGSAQPSATGGVKASKKANIEATSDEDSE